MARPTETTRDSLLWPGGLYYTVAQTYGLNDETMQQSIHFKHILSDQKVPGCPDQLEYVQIGGGLGGFSWLGMEHNENPYKTRKSYKSIENHRKLKTTTCIENNRNQ